MVARADLRVVTRTAGGFRRGSRPLTDAEWANLTGDRVQSPGKRCPAVDGSFLCSRDEGHPGAHVSRSESGPGCVGWFNEAAS